MKNIIRLMRPGQWVKNLFVFLPMFFNGSMTNAEYWQASLWAFVVFCLASSAVYCLNDLCDAEFDRQHPSKRNRPIASGAVGKGTAVALMIFLAAFAVALSILVFGISWPLLIVVLYLLLNVLYTLKLKQIAIVDVITLSFGFVLRVLMGGLACHIVLSEWIIVMTFLLSLFLAVAKRRDDVIVYNTDGALTRKSVSGYSLKLINQILSMLSSVIIVAYLMYTLSPDTMARFGSEYIYTTAIFVIAGILRYLQLANGDGKTGSPTAIFLHDRFIQVCVLGWVILFSLFIYVR